MSTTVSSLRNPSVGLRLAEADLDLCRAVSRSLDDAFDDAPLREALALGARITGSGALLVALKSAKPRAFEWLWAQSAQDLTDADRYRLLSCCVERGDIERAQWLVGHGVPLHKPAWSGLDPGTLMHVAAYATAEMVRWVAAQGLSADGVEERSPGLLRPLHQAILYAPERCLELVEAFLEAGADANAASGRDRYGALHWVARQGGISHELWRTLLAAGADPRAADIDGNTPLMLLARTHAEPSNVLRLPVLDPSAIAVLEAEFEASQPRHFFATARTRIRRRA